MEMTLLITLQLVSGQVDYLVKVDTPVFLDFPLSVKLHNA